MSGLRRYGRSSVSAACESKTPFMTGALPPSTLDVATLRRLGFKCLAPTIFALPDDSSVTVLADGWMLADTTLPKDDAEARCLRLYHVLYSNGGLELLDENDVIALVGKSGFENALVD